MSKNFGPMSEEERIRLIKAALVFCEQKVTPQAIREQFYRETKEYPKSVPDQMEKAQND